MACVQYTLWTVNGVKGAFQLERPLRSCKLKFEGSFQDPTEAAKTPWGLYRGSFPVTSLTVHSVCNMYFLVCVFSKRRSIKNNNNLFQKGFQHITIFYTCISMQEFEGVNLSIILIMNAYFLHPKRSSNQKVCTYMYIESTYMGENSTAK